MNRLTVISISAAFLFSACSEKKNETATTIVADSVEVFILKKETVTKALALPAELHPWERAEVYAKVQGYVKELKVDIGDRVKKNEVLLILDAPEVTASYAKSLADLQAAQSIYHTSLDTYRRVVNASKEKGAVSDNEMARMRNQMLSDSASYEAAKAGASADAQLKNYLVIRAAFDGVVTERNIDLGTLVVAGQKPMFVLENIAKLRLRVAIPETYTAAIPESPAISFSVDAQPYRKYSARLARKSNQIDTRTRTELWEFEVMNASGELKSGMYARASFNLQRTESSFVVPHSAVVTNQERSFVISVRDGKTVWVDVRSGIGMKDKVEIFADLQEGEKLVSKATDELKPGTAIVIK